MTNKTLGRLLHRWKAIAIALFLSGAVWLIGIIVLWWNSPIGVAGGGSMEADDTWLPQAMQLWTALVGVLLGLALWRLATSAEDTKK